MRHGDRIESIAQTGIRAAREVKQASDPMA